jgi:hypothetical protein
MDDERNPRWQMGADDLRHFRTQLTNALLATGQLGRRHMQSADAERLHAHLSAALNRLVARLRQIEQRGHGDDAA